MKKQVYSVFPQFLISLILVACATPQLSREQLIEKYPALVQLETEVDKAANDGINLLAPVRYQKAFASYIEAHTAMTSGQTKVSNDVATGGLATLKKSSHRCRQ